MLKVSKNSVNDILLKTDRLGEMNFFFVSDLQDVWLLDVKDENEGQNSRLGSSGQNDHESSALNVRPELDVYFDVLSMFER